MIRKLTIQSFLQEEFSHIIDVRSPREFAESHIPSVVNFAVLNDSEFEQVGTLYKQNPFEARVLGASFVSAIIKQAQLTILYLANVIIKAKRYDKPQKACWNPLRAWWNA